MATILTELSLEVAAITTNNRRPILQPSSAANRIFYLPYPQIIKFENGKPNAYAWREYADPNIGNADHRINRGSGGEIPGTWTGSDGLSRHFPAWNCGIVCWWVSVPSSFSSASGDTKPICIPGVSAFAHRGDRSPRAVSRSHRTAVCYLAKQPQTAVQSGARYAE